MSCRRPCGPRAHARVASVSVVLRHPCRWPCRLRADARVLPADVSAAPVPKVCATPAGGRPASVPTTVRPPRRRWCDLRTVCFWAHVLCGCCADNSCGPCVHAPTLSGRRHWTLDGIFFLDPLSTSFFHNIPVVSLADLSTLARRQKGTNGGKDPGHAWAATRYIHIPNEPEKAADAPAPQLASPTNRDRSAKVIGGPYLREETPRFMCWRDLRSLAPGLRAWKPTFDSGLTVIPLWASPTQGGS